MKTVLIVDDEKDLILSIEAGFEAFKDRFKVMTAENGRQALEILDSTKVDLVATDLRMPEMDGIELIAHMRKHFPHIPTIVMSAFGTPEIEQQLEDMGTLRYIEKPVDFDELAQSILDGLKLVSEGGSLSGISVMSFLQMIEMDEKTCLLELEDDAQHKGAMYFNQGEIFDAVCGDLRGEEAAIEMMVWDDVQIHVRNLPEKAMEKRIGNDLFPLLLEASKRKDEAGGSNKVYRDDIINRRQRIKGKKDASNPAENDDGSSINQQLVKILDDLAEAIEGVMLISIIGRDGIGIAEYVTDGSNVEDFNSNLTMVMKMAEQAVKNLSNAGGLQANMIQTEHAWILTQGITSYYWFGISVNRRSTIGNVRLVVDEYTDVLRKVLSE